MDFEKHSHVSTTKVPYKTVPSLQKFLLLSLQSHLSRTPQLVATAALFSICVVLSFPQYHIYGFMQYGAFWFWLLAFSKMHF